MRCQGQRKWECEEDGRSVDEVGRVGGGNGQSRTVEDSNKMDGYGGSAAFPTFTGGQYIAVYLLSM